MSNTSSHHEKNAKNTSSGQGAAGMGGSPTDDPRDLARGGDGRSYDDEANAAPPVPGASGSPAGAQADATEVASQAYGQAGDRGAMADVEAALKKSPPVDPQG